MSFWSGVKSFFGGGVVGRALDIGAKVVVNKDKLLKLAAESDQAELNAYIAGLQVSTYTWIDALHKMGRQIQQYLILGFVFYASKNSYVVDPNAWLVLGGLSGIYSVMKGRGSK